jgi:hypothetical protein
MAGDYIPGGLAEFDAWQSNFVDVFNYILSGLTVLPAVVAEWELLTQTPGVKKIRWDNAWSIVKTKEFKHSQETELLSALRDYISGNRSDVSDTSLRLFIARYIRFNPAITKEQKKQMGLTVPKDKNSNTSDTGAKLSGIEIDGIVRKSTHLHHYNDVKVAGQRSNAKPEGVENIQVFIAFTDVSVKTAPAISAFAYDGVVKCGKYVREFDAAREGMRAWYYARVMIKGKTATYGPPSVIWSAMIM